MDNLFLIRFLKWPTMGDRVGRSEVTLDEYCVVVRGGGGFHGADRAGKLEI